LVKAQKQYIAHTASKVPKQFAQKLVSGEGLHNGLYWQGAHDQVDSPVEPLIV
jgi:Protein of unknown function (DUF2950)